MEVGSAGHRPMARGGGRHPLAGGGDPDPPPSCRSPPSDFDASLESALELFPSLVRGTSGPGSATRSMACPRCRLDGLPIIGEQPEVRGLWSANRVDIKMAPAVARTLATWMVRGLPGERPPAVRHRPLPSPRANRAPRGGPDHRGLDAGCTRWIHPARGVHLEPRPPAEPRPRAGSWPSAGVFSDQAGWEDREVVHRQ